MCVLILVCYISESVRFSLVNWAQGVEGGVWQATKNGKGSAREEAAKCVECWNVFRRRRTKENRNTIYRLSPANPDYSRPLRVAPLINKRWREKRVNPPGRDIFYDHLLRAILNIHAVWVGNECARAGESGSRTLIPLPMNITNSAANQIFTNHQLFFTFINSKLLL